MTKHQSMALSHWEWRTWWRSPQPSQRRRIEHVLSTSQGECSNQSAIVFQILLDHCVPKCNVMQIYKIAQCYPKVVWGILAWNRRYINSSPQRQVLRSSSVPARILCGSIRGDRMCAAVEIVDDGGQRMVQERTKDRIKWKFMLMTTGSENIVRFLYIISKFMDFFILTMKIHFCAFVNIVAFPLSWHRPK